MLAFPKKCTTFATEMKLYQFIEKMIDDNSWLSLCAICDQAMDWNRQFAIFQLVQKLEPKRTYGYRKRIADYVSANGLHFFGGGYFASGRLLHYSRYH